MFKKIKEKKLVEIVYVFNRLVFLFLIISLAVFSFAFSLGEEQPQIDGGSDPLPELRLGFITDLHIKSNSINEVRSDRKIKDHFIDTIENFRYEMTQNFHPDAIINNGDVIEGTNRDYVVGMGELRKTKKLFDEFNVPLFWVVGNHDLRAVNKQQWKESLEIDYLFKAFDLKGYRIIILDSNFRRQGTEDIAPGRYFTRGKISQLQNKWLEAELRATKKKTLIFLHHPPLSSSDVEADSKLLSDVETFQEIISQSGDVLAVFSGHIEELHHKIKDGIHYFIIPGTTKNPDFQKTFSEIIVNNDEIKVKVKYWNEKGAFVPLNADELGQ